MALMLTACPPGPPPPPATAYNITLAFGSNISNADKAVFQSAAGRWQGIITNDLPDVPSAVQASDCDPGATGFPTVNSIDDLVIFADVVAIDGPGGTLGQAGPCRTRQAGSQLPAVGIMQFDSADMDALRTANQLRDTIVHEMGHVIGIGTLWKQKNLLQGAGAEGACGNTPVYTGTNAKAEYAALGRSGNIPVEGAADGSGPGTCDSHWRESTFGPELMTGYLDSGVANPLSRMSIASLKDLGYAVDLSKADPYMIPASVSTIRPESVRSKLRVVLLEPKGTLP